MLQQASALALPWNDEKKKKRGQNSPLFEQTNKNLKKGHRITLQVIFANVCRKIAPYLSRVLFPLFRKVLDEFLLHV